MSAEPISSVRSAAGRAVSTLARRAAGAGASAARLVALAMLLAAAPAAAEEPARRALTPPDPAAPTPVYLDLYGLEIYDIDEREQTFEIGARLSASWRDERLAFDADEVDALEYDPVAASWSLAFDGSALPIRPRSVPISSPWRRGSPPRSRRWAASSSRSRSTVCSKGSRPPSSR